MAQIVTITNPLTGQPAQVDQLEHTAQQIDDAIARALPGGAIDIALQKKENSFSILPLSKGGTGGKDVFESRANLGICKQINCSAGSSITVTLPKNSVCLIGISDNVHGGLILVNVVINNRVSSVQVINTLIGWSYAVNNYVLTLSETGGYGASISVVTLCASEFSGGVY